MKHMWMVMTAVVLGLGLSAHAAISDGLVAYLPFDADMQDVVGSYDATVVGGGSIAITAAGGQLGGFADKSGSAGKLELPIHLGSGSFTISHWIRDYNGGNGAATGNQTYGAQGFYTYVDGALQRHENRNASGAGQRGEWNHGTWGTAWIFEVLTFDADTGTFTGRAYDPETQFHKWTDPVPSVMGAGSSIDSGLNLFVAGAGDNDQDDLAIWNRVLTFAEMEEIRLAGQAGNALSTFPGVIVPEPATMSLLALGGLAALLRRRK
ncbi:MAG: PEP-CTERM sorting domain-containing protein [Planctomycetaceae bacterium]|nr:PEP-CTERM sorting domain-containing protein [Planctomycetaceae bacterium]